VKRTPRAVIAAFIITMAAAAAQLPFSVPALASPVPPAPNPALSGTWANTNPATRNIVDIVIEGNKSGIEVDGFGACSPTPCQWGNVPGTVFGANVSSATGSSFEANWNFGFARTVLLGALAERNRVWSLTVQEFTTFTDSSGRADYAVTETFVRAKPIAAARSGTAGVGYPLGDSVAPAPSLLGTWVNTAPASPSIRKIVIGRNPAGTLSVSAFGACTPTLCAWGKITGITFGTAISSASGRTFLAPYQFGFAKKLAAGALNATETVLTVQTYTEFTDSSGRSNYVSTDTFTRG
jgi:hypothetical protein